jgi:hypothetical protein
MKTIQTLLKKNIATISIEVFKEIHLYKKFLPENTTAHNFMMWLSFPLLLLPYSGFLVILLSSQFPL